MQARAASGDSKSESKSTNKTIVYFISHTNGLNLTQLANPSREQVEKLAKVNYYDMYSSLQKIEEEISIWAERDRRYPLSYIAVEFTQSELSKLHEKAKKVPLPDLHFKVKIENIHNIHPDAYDHVAETGFKFGTPEYDAFKAECLAGYLNPFYHNTPDSQSFSEDPTQLESTSGLLQPTINKESKYEKDTSVTHVPSFVTITKEQPAAIEIEKPKQSKCTFFKPEGVAKIYFISQTDLSLKELKKLTPSSLERIIEGTQISMGTFNSHKNAEKAIAFWGGGHSSIRPCFYEVTIPKNELPSFNLSKVNMNNISNVHPSFDYVHDVDSGVKWPGSSPEWQQAVLAFENERTQGYANSQYNRLPIEETTTVNILKK